MPEDPEVQAMVVIQGRLEGLDEPARARVIAWLYQRYGVSNGTPVTARRPGSARAIFVQLLRNEGKPMPAHELIAQAMSQPGGPATKHSASNTLARMADEGQLHRVAHGLYDLPEPTES